MEYFGICLVGIVEDRRSVGSVGYGWVRFFVLQGGHWSWSWFYWDGLLYWELLD